MLHRTTCCFQAVLFGRGGDEKLAPTTSRVLRRLCGSDVLGLCSKGGGEIIFSRIGAQSRILPHCGPTNLRLTCHLGLLVPPQSAGKCAIRVGREWRRWTEGKCLIFDDSFEHEVVNETSLSRIVLLIRFWHPNLTQRPHALQYCIQMREQVIHLHACEFIRSTLRSRLGLSRPLGAPTCSEQA